MEVRLIFSRFIWFDFLQEVKPHRKKKLKILDAMLDQEEPDKPVQVDLAVRVNDRIQVYRKLPLIVTEIPICRNK